MRRRGARAATAPSWPPLTPAERAAWRAATSAPLVVRVDGLQLRVNKNARHLVRDRIGHVARERDAAFAAVHNALVRRGRIAPPFAVRMTRVAPTKVKDDDNLTGYCSQARDGVAAALRVDDGDPRVFWARPRQRSEGPGRYALVVEIFPGVGPCAACGGCGAVLAEADAPAGRTRRRGVRTGR